jgi:putative DNA primase/helicase
VTDPLRFRRLDSVEMRSISWLDRPLWQRAAFQLVIGRKGVGKGTYIAGLAARMTLGELYERPMNVLILASEDSDEIDVKPRIVAAGGDPSRIHTLDEAMLLPRDVPRLRAAALEIGDVGLVILDPIASYVRGDTHAEEPVRVAIDPLNGLANELDCLLVGVRHLSEKDATKGALAATLGASAWVQVPRAVLAVAADDEQDLLFHIAVVGGNRSARGAGRVFQIDLVDIEGLDEPITRATEIGTSAKSVDDLLGGGDDRKRKAPKRTKAREVILRELAGGAEPLDYLKSKCIAEIGCSGETVWQAANELKSERLISSSNSGPGTPWLWFLTSGSGPGETTEYEVTDFVTKSVTLGSPVSPENGTKSGSADPLNADLSDGDEQQELIWLESLVPDPGDIES